MLKRVLYTILVMSFSGLVLAGPFLMETDVFGKSVVRFALSFDEKTKASIVREYKKYEYEHQLIYLDTRSHAENKEEIANKIREFGENLDDKGLVLMLDSGVAESRKALAKVLKDWGQDPSKYSPSEGPFLIGHVEIVKTGKKVEGKTHITDFSGMNTACIKDYIDNIEWSVLIKDIGSDVARARWTERSLICEGSKISDEGYSDSIQKAYEYFRTWFK